MGIQDHLLRKTRENSGSSSSNRFDFQKDWALCHLLELHGGTRDYVLVFEHHEDIVVLYIGTEAESADCYQIKTKQPGSWSLANLLYRKKLNQSSALSILGKMYGNIDVFGAGATTVNFVSNALYSLKYQDGSSCESRECICLGEIDPAALQKIRAQLQQEHAIEGEVSFGPECHLRVTNLSLHDHSTHAMGKLEQFLASTRPGRVYAISTLYRTLFDEVRRRSNYEWNVSSLDALLRNKALSRTQFQSFLDTVPEAKDFDLFWTQASGQLSHESWAFSDIQRLRKACQSHEVSRMDLNNDLLKRIVATAREIATKVSTDPGLPTLTLQLDAAMGMLEASNIPGAEMFDLFNRRAIVLMAIYEY